MTELRSNRNYVLKEYPGGWAICEHPYNLFGKTFEPLLFSSSSKRDCLELLRKSGASYIEKTITH